MWKRRLFSSAHHRDQGAGTKQKMRQNNLQRGLDGALEFVSFVANSWKKNVQRSIKVPQERQLHDKLNSQLTLPTVSLAPCTRSSLMTSHTNHGTLSSLHWRKEKSPMLNQPHPVLVPSCQSLLWISIFPFFSSPYFPYFSHVCSDPSVPSTVHLLSVFLLFHPCFSPLPPDLSAGLPNPCFTVVTQLIYFP